MIDVTIEIAVKESANFIQSPLVASLPTWALSEYITLPT